MATDLDSKQRFGDRVESYRRARPSYPRALYDHLEHELGLGSGTRVADLGSGTGIFCAPLLDREARVWAVEPNAAMRAGAERDLGDRPGFTSVAGSAEATSLADRSIDLVTAAQSFHWFDLPATRREVARILRPAGHAALIWNSRPPAGSPFLDAYERFLEQWGRDYELVRATYAIRDGLADFFDGDFERRVFPHRHVLDLAGLRARIASSSYMPAEDSASFQPMVEALRHLFDQHAEQGTVAMDYETELFSGRLRGD